jgi:hypothetical protein
MHYSLALVLLAASAAAQTPPQSLPNPRTGAEAVVAPEKGSKDEQLGRAASRPLRDLNIMKPKLAAELEAIMAAPYDVAGLRTCRGLNGEVNRMTGLVGPDVDDPGLNARKGRDPVEFLLDSAEGITGSLVPGQGIIREITGANKAARKVAAARLAGQLRRSYIKGIMKARGCRLSAMPAPTATNAR